jgi:hypothetical protein
VGTYLFGSILFYFILFYVLANFGHLATINVCSATHKKKDQTFVGEKNMPKLPDFEDSLENCHI